MDVDALVALQADQARPGRGGQRTGDLRLADPSLALQQQRRLQRAGQEDRRGQRAVGQVALALERRPDGVDGPEGTYEEAASRSARAVSTRARCRL
jgi:hypothetical protein